MQTPVEVENRKSRVCRRALLGAVRLGNWLERHTLALALLVLIVTAAPPRAQGQLPSPCCLELAAGLGTINSSIVGVIGGGLQAIFKIQQLISQFEQTVVWPEKAISAARGLVAQLQGTFQAIQAILGTRIATATLPATQQLERILLSRSATQMGATTAAYGTVYGTLPAIQAAPPAVRNVIDMTDAGAQDALERAIAIDAIADQELAAANQINASIQSAAPGSAPLIEAQADAWVIRAHAYTQSALAELMRVRALDLANHGANLKLGSAAAVALQQNVTQTLQH